MGCMGRGGLRSRERSDSVQIVQSERGRVVIAGRRVLLCVVRVLFFRDCVFRYPCCHTVCCLCSLCVCAVVTCHVVLWPFQEISVCYFYFYFSKPKLLCTSESSFSYPSSLSLSPHASTLPTLPHCCKTLLHDDCANIYDTTPPLTPLSFCVCVCYNSTIYNRYSYSYNIGFEISLTHGRGILVFIDNISCKGQKQNLGLAPGPIRLPPSRGRAWLGWPIFGVKSNRLV